MAKRPEINSYWFDPTGNEASALADMSLTKVVVKPGVDHASPEDIERYTGGYVFEPGRLISRGERRRQKYALKLLGRRC